MMLLLDLSLKEAQVTIIDRICKNFDTQISEKIPVGELVA